MFKKNNMCRVWYFPHYPGFPLAWKHILHRYDHCTPNLDSLFFLTHSRLLQGGKLPLLCESFEVLGSLSLADLFSYASCIVKETKYKLQKKWFAFESYRDSWIKISAHSLIDIISICVFIYLMTILLSYLLHNKN